MPKSKKKASEMTTDELAKRVFPKKALKEIRRVANEEPKKPRNKPTRSLQG